MKNRRRVIILMFLTSFLQGCFWNKTPVSTTPPPSSPSIMIGAPTKTFATSADTITYRVTYTGASQILLTPSLVSTLSDQNVQCTVSTEAMSKELARIHLSQCTGDGWITVQVLAGSAVNSIGLPVPASSTSAAFEVQNSGPRVYISPPEGTFSSDGYIGYTLTYEGAATYHVHAEDLNIHFTDSALCDPPEVTQEGSPNIYKVYFWFCSGDGSVSLDVSRGTAYDEQGNPALSAGPSEAIQLRLTPPVVTISPPQGNPVSGQGTFQIDVTGATQVVMDSSTITPTVLGNLTCDFSIVNVSPTSAKAVFSGCSSGSGTLHITTGYNLAVDEDGNNTYPVTSEKIYINPIKNPYFKAPEWKLWTLNAAPVVTHLKTFPLTLMDTRLYPDETATLQYPKPIVKLKTLPVQGFFAGFWDDAYVTEDGAHTLMPLSRNDEYQNTIDLSQQYIRQTSYLSPEEKMKIGVNFTSMSVACAGHELINQPYTLSDTEKNYLFSNTVRGTPGYLSYREVYQDRSIDSFDALYSHTYISLGRSDSETRGLFKMLVAGGHLPRATKDLLKLHGAYASTLLMIFRAALPYADENGSELSFENELRHRPVYASDGQHVPYEFARINVDYHGYDDERHLAKMILLAKSMDIAPPVAILKLLEMRVEKDGAILVDHTTTDPRILSSHKTILRIWPQVGETVTLRVDTGDSYDLQGLPLTFQWSQSYPNQTGVSITQEGTGNIYQIRITHNPSLPRMRIPVMLTASNGRFHSNPAFINFYWPLKDQTPTGYYHDPNSSCMQPSACPNKPYYYSNYNNPLYEINHNLRPALTLSDIPETRMIQVSPGGTVRFGISCTDPEGFPTRIFRWAGEPGVIRDGGFSHQFSITEPDGIHRVHIICSDGTGAYDSTHVTLIVRRDSDLLPSGWFSAPLGLPEVSGSISAEDSNNTILFKMKGNGHAMVHNTEVGTFTYTKTTGDFDTIARIQNLFLEGSLSYPAPSVGLMIRSEVTDVSPMIFNMITGNSPSNWTASSTVRNAGPWTAGHPASPGLIPSPQYVRIIRRANSLSSFVSADLQNWEEILNYSNILNTHVLTGLGVVNTDQYKLDGEPQFARAEATWILPDQQTAIPIIALQGELGAFWQSNQYRGEVKVMLQPDPTAPELHYTLDGTEPTGDSTVYSSVLILSTPGAYTLQVRAFRNHHPLGGLVIMKFEIVSR